MKEKLYNEEEIVNFRVMAPLFELLEPHINLLISERLNEIVNNSIPQSAKSMED